MFQGGKTLRREKTIEHGVFCNGDLIITPEKERKLFIKMNRMISTVELWLHKKDKIRNMVAGIYRRCRRIYKMI